MRRVLVLCTVILTVFSLTVPAVAQPDNDDLASAAAVTGLPFDDTLDTTEATVETGEPLDGLCPPRGSTVWYELTLAESQVVAIDTAGSDYDTTIAVYTGTEFSDLTLVDCNDDTFFGLQAALTMSADAGVPYLIQVGSFGGDGGGQLQLSIGAPEKATGKPVIFKSRFRGVVADAYLETFDEETGAFSFTGATLIDGQGNEQGKPTKFADLFVSQYTETIDEPNETVIITEWFGSAELSRDQYALDKKLRSAWAEADLTLFGQTCSFGFEDEVQECTDLGTAVVSADLSWQGIGGIEKSKYRESTTADGVRLMFRGSSSTRNANVAGGWSGEQNADLSGASGSISLQSSGDFVMIRGAGTS
jgi:hypothetical protein